MISVFSFQVSGGRFQTSPHRFTASLVCCLVCGLLLAKTGFSGSFDEQRKAMQGNIPTQSEETMLSLLQAALQEGKTFPAIAETRKWLAQNRPENPLFFYYAGRAAELSGAWQDAVSLYQQYLVDADLTSDTADEAVFAVYVLLLERLNNEEAAYNFSKNEGNRLLVTPRARQFDMWFLERAVEWRRKDVDAVVNRLLGCLEAGYPADLMVARYDQYFRWLLRQLDRRLKEAPSIDDARLKTYKQLATKISFSSEIKLRLDWLASVLHYNQAKLQGQEVEPPLAEARALLASFPAFALHVQTDWMGGSQDLHSNNVDDLNKYWSDSANEKMTVVVEAISRMDVDQKISFFRGWRPGYYNERQRFEPKFDQTKVVQEYLDANPDVMNLRNGPIAFGKDWDQLSVEEAKKFAPYLAGNTHSDASAIRAIATGEKDYEKLMQALIESELWRLDKAYDSISYGDKLWHYSGRKVKGEKRDEWKNKGQSEFEKTSISEPSADAPLGQRIDVFKRLWSDYTSSSPKIPGNEASLRRIIRMTPEVVPVMLKMDNPDAQRLLRDAIHDGISGTDQVWTDIKDAVKVNVYRYDPNIQQLADRHHRGHLEELKKHKPQMYIAHPFEEHFRSAVADGMQKGELASWIVMAWINMQSPEINDEQIALMQALRKSPVWNQLSFEVQFGAREWFERSAMTAAEVAWLGAGRASQASEPLLALTEESDVAAVQSALKVAIERSMKSPIQFQIQGMDQLGNIAVDVFESPEVFSQVLEIVDGLRYSSQDEHQEFGDRLFAVLKKRNDSLLYDRCAAYLGKYASRGSRGGKYEPMIELIENLLTSDAASAGAIASSTLSTFEKAGNIYGFEPSKRVPELRSLVGKASMRLGLITIPVAPTHATYPIYKSQADWLIGNEDSAWNLLVENWEEFMPMYRKLSVDYLMWVLQRTIYSRDEEMQEPLIKALQDWATEPDTALSLQRQVEVELAYGDIAIQKGLLREAHEIYKRTEKKEAFQDLNIKYEATLRKARVQRLAKDFDGALNTLNELALEKIPSLWSRIHYAIAEVYYDMEEYDDANDEVNLILAREPEHADAKIMQGRLQLKRKKLMEATEVELGTISSKQTLVPGEKLKVTLTDPTLAVSGAGTEIEVVVWATSGDRELIFLRQFGDEKTKFRGEVPTKLGAGSEDDGVLQVIGNDEVFYAYSERFRAKMNNMEEKRGGPITVASDALLMASGRRLLTEAEQRVADMEAQMNALKDGTVGKAKAQMAADISERMMQGEMGESEDISATIENRLKPGSPLHIRVIDYDRSRTAGIDELPVSVSTSSGDAIGRVILKETDTHSGWFEGSVKTAGAQAMAYARNTEPGRNPNMVISPRNDYPPWQPVVGTKEKPELMINLNDNVPLGSLTVSARESGAKLQKFVVQTGMNDRDLQVVGVYPDKIRMIIDKPWHPQVTVMNDTDHHHTRNDRSVYNIRELQDHVNRGWMMQQYAAGIAENVVGTSVAMDPSIPAKVEWKRQNRHHNAHVIYRFRGYFFEPEEVERRFRVDLGKWTPAEMHPSVTHDAEYALAINGRIVSEQREKPVKSGGAVRLEGSMKLRRGVHTFEIWATGWDGRIGFGRDVKVSANLESPNALAACPDSFFDPDSFPAGVLAHRNGLANIESSDDGKSFQIEFSPDSRARILNFVFIAQEGPVPIINKISLKRPDGGTVLPVEYDYSELNKNDILEILTGDSVAVRYTDDRYVSKSKENHERFLNVAFSDAKVSFQFFEMRRNRSNTADEPYYEKQLRFQYGQPITLTVIDPDMDMSPEADVLTLGIKSDDGALQKVEAVEEFENPGHFRVRITPVAGTPTGPNEISVKRGGTLTAVYRDTENTAPGVPIDRLAMIQHAIYREPRMRISHSIVKPIDFDAREYPINPVKLTPGFQSYGVSLVDEDAPVGLADLSARKTTSTAGAVVPRWEIFNDIVDAVAPPDGGIHAVHGQMMYFQIEAPHLALRTGSKVSVYAQTESGRNAVRSQQNTVEIPFDISVPGTIKLAGLLDIVPKHGVEWRLTPRIPIYIGGKSPFLAEYERRKRGESSWFVCSVPLIAGVLPENGVLNLSAKEMHELGIPQKHGLVVKPGEKIYVGFEYTDESGTVKWLTGEARVVTHPVMDVLEEDYRSKKSEAYVGENLYLRVVDLGGDVSDRSDTVKVHLQAKSGATFSVDLLEVDSHSGVFKAPLPLTYARRGELPDDYNALREGCPVVYGDVVGSIYVDSSKQRTPMHAIRIRRGADGSITPFSKQYEDEEMAMQTQFALAEAYLEMAKNHRGRGAEEEASRKYDQARRLLASVIDQFRDPDTRSHAEYLLGDLTQEEADATEAGELQEQRYRAALARFLSVTGTYPDTQHASMAQFKIATIYEKLGEPDIAAQEYVKLAYKYPQSEFLALAMARLGTHFLRRASGYEQQAKERLAKTENKDAQFEGEAMHRMAVREYLNAGSIFGRMLERFPSHELAGQCGLRAGQAYMRADSMRQALQTFLAVVDNESYDGPDIRAQAMYWAGMCYENVREAMAAYAIYKRLTFDFPESKWAAYARGQLSQERMLVLETDLEIERLKAEGNQ